MKAELLSRERSILVLVDVQEKLVAAIPDAARLVPRVALLLDCATRLGIPVLATRQYPQGLGPVVPELAAALPPGAEPVDKLEFSCAAHPEFARRLAAAQRDQVVIAGVETHVCVAQTAVEVAAGGRTAFVVADACASRKETDAAWALRRLASGGVAVTTAEAVVFEWLRRAGTPEFKAVQERIKAILA